MRESGKGEDSEGESVREGGGGMVREVCEWGSCVSEGGCGRGRVRVRVGVRE